MSAPVLPLSTRHVRAYLAVRASEPAGFGPAYGAGADAVVLDLDKPVADADKDRAREAVAGFLETARPLPTLVRINGPDTGLTLADLDAVVAPGLTAIRLPRVESAAWLRDVARHVERRRVQRGLAAPIGLEVFVGTAAGLRRIDELATATHSVWRLGLGEESLYAEIGSSSDAALQLARLQVVQASRAAQLPGPVQKSFLPAWGDEALRQTSRSGAGIGYTARTVWNARHVAILRQAQSDFLASPILTASGRRPPGAWDA